MLGPNKKAVLLFILAVVPLLYLLVKYLDLVSYFCVASILALVIVRGKPVYSLALFVSLYWIPIGVSYWIFSGLFKEAMLPEVIFYFAFIVLFLTSRYGKSKKSDGVGKATPFIWCLILFFIGSLIAYLIGKVNGEDVAYDVLRKNCIYGPMVYFMIAKAIKNDHDSAMVSLSLLIGSCICAWSIFHGLDFGIEKRLTGEFLLTGREMMLNATAIGAYSAVMIPLAFSLYVFGDKKYYRLVGFISLLVFIPVLITTLTRASWIAAFFGILTVCAFGLETGIRRMLMVLVFVLVLAAISIAYINFFAGISENLVSRFQSIGSFSSDESFLARQHIWFSSFELFMENPMGMGFRYSYPLKGWEQYTHNLYLGALLSSGLIGAFGLFAFMFLSVKKALLFLKSVACDQHKMLVRGCAGSMAAFFFCGIFENQLTVPEYLMIPIWVILGILAAEIRVSRQISEGPDKPACIPNR